MQFLMQLYALDNGVDVLPYLCITTCLDDGLVKDAIGLVHLHHSVVVDAKAHQGGNSHEKERVVAPQLTLNQPWLHLT